ncbi:CsbD family protein [Paenibacillus sp. J45TS6]|uniref:CsbD family protein n=2 Tax=Paenibacillus TaxID=44249 RepID=A0ABY8X2F2_9BACL|nr:MULTISPECIES: CsbD family protein [Paenibacillus]MBD7968753.1 CsbD family protein [Paenibacillus gallinarum]WIV19610.1 CsbD family protein [Paenibacillus polygoni]GIP44205.1 CsbD family protein [Paenibacillus sp. J45TS6]
MDNNVFKGKWTQMKGEAKKQWGKLTDDDLDVINGEKDKLIGKLQEKYGHTREQAETEYNNWSNTNVR